MVAQDRGEMDTWDGDGYWVSFRYDDNLLKLNFVDGYIIL